MVILDFVVDLLILETQFLLMWIEAISDLMKGNFYQFMSCGGCVDVKEKRKTYNTIMKLIIHFGSIKACSLWYSNFGVLLRMSMGSHYYLLDIVLF